VIDGSAGALRATWDQMGEGERDELLAGIRGSAHRLRRLGADLGTASRLHGETLRLRLEDMSLTQALRDAVARSQFSESGAQVELDVPDGAIVHADAGRLAQAVDNLLDNALRHGASPIALSGTVTHKDVHIRVSDAGPGVPADLIPRLFARFAIAGASGGTGLGLYLVREIARAHGGEAEYRPPGPGQRATFEITLPRRT
jgi:signal transduction histidine kinase